MAAPKVLIMMADYGHEPTGTPIASPWEVITAAS
jgi:hypothetical protein